MERDKLISEDWVKESDKQNSRVMVVTAMSGRGVLPFFQFPQKTKGNADVHFGNILRPLLDVHVAVMYPGELDKVVDPHDSVPAHTAKKTHAYAQGLQNRTGIRPIPYYEKPIKSPYIVRRTSSASDTSRTMFKVASQLRGRAFGKSYWNSETRYPSPWSTISTDLKNEDVVL